MDYRDERHNEAPAGLIVEAILAEIGRKGAAPSKVMRSEETPVTKVPKNLKRFFAGAGASRSTLSCCSTEEQATCCDSAENASCCGSSSSSSCGCR